MGKQEKNLYKGKATEATTRLVQHIGSKQGGEMVELIELATLITQLNSEIKKLEVDIDTTTNISEKNKKIDIYNKAIDELKKAHELQAQKTKKGWNHVLPLKKDSVISKEEKAKDLGEENNQNTNQVETSGNESMSEEDKMLLGRLRSQASDTTKGADLQYFIDKAGENPTSFIETFGEDLFKKLIDRVPTEKLKEHLGFARSIDEAGDVSIALDEIITKREKGVNDAEKDNKEQNERKNKMDELFKQFMNSINERKNLEKRLAEIDKQLEDMDKQPEKEPGNEESGENKNPQEQDKPKVIGLDDFKWSYGSNYVDRLGTLKIDNVMVTIKEISEKEVKRSFFGRLTHISDTKKVKLDKPYFEIRVRRPDTNAEIIQVENIETALGEINDLVKEDLKQLETELKKDMEQKPFLYFALEKSNNGLIIDRNKTANRIDLRLCDESWRDLIRNTIATTAKNEGFFEYNIYGFVKVIQNVNELRSDKGIELYSDKAIYKIIGPNEKIMAEGIKGYDEATRIYNEMTEKYKKQVEEDFKKLNEVK